MLLLWQSISNALGISLCLLARTQDLVYSSPSSLWGRQRLIQSLISQEFLYSPWGSIPFESMTHQKEASRHAIGYIKSISSQKEELWPFMLGVVFICWWNMKICYMFPVCVKINHGLVDSLREETGPCTSWSAQPCAHTERTGVHQKPYDWSPE